MIFIWLYPEQFGKCKGNPMRRRGPRMLLSGALTWNNHRIQNIRKAEWGARSPSPSALMRLLQGQRLISDRLDVPDHTSGKGWPVNEGKVELTFSPERSRGWHTPSPAGCSGKTYPPSESGCSKEPGGNEVSLGNVRSGQCPILAGGNLP